MRIKKQLAAVLIIVLMLICFAACSKAPSDSSLIANGNFVSYAPDGSLALGDVDYANWVRENPTSTYDVYKLKEETFTERSAVPVYANNKYKTARWSKVFPEGWKVKTSDPAIASLSGFEYGEKGEDANAVTFIVDASATKTGGQTPVGCGWIQIYQKVRVNPRTNYKVTFEYTGTMRKPHSSLGDKANNAVGVGIGFLEDPSYITQGAVNTNISDKSSFEQYTSIVFNSGSLRHLTVCISLGAPGHDIGDSRISIRRIAMIEELSAQSVHTVYKNGGYRDSNAAAVVIAVAAFILLAAVCFFITYYVNKNYAYSKAKEDGDMIKSAKRGKGGRKADLAADEGDSVEILLTDGGDAADPQEETIPEEGGETAADEKGAQGYTEDTGFEDGAAAGGKPQKKDKSKLRSLIEKKVFPALKTAWAKQPFLMLLGLAFILRIVCVLLFKGYRPDIDSALAAANNILTDGVKYYQVNGVGYAPGQLYIFYYIGLFMRWFNLTEGGLGTAFFFKLPILAADLGIGWLIYDFTKKFVNKKTALGISALYLFNPAVLFAFEIWGGMSAAWLFFLVLALRYMLDRKYLRMCAAYAGAVLFSASALAVAPLLAVFLIAVFVKAFSAYLRRSEAEKKASEGLLSLPKYSAIWKAPLAILLFFVSLLILCLPLTASGIEVGESFKLFSFCAVFKELATNFAFHTNNGFNVAAFMGRNGPAFTDVSDSALILVYFLISALLAAVYIMKKNRANLLLLGSFLYFFTAYFMAGATPLTAVPGLIMLLLACAAVGDRRLYGHYLIFSALCLLNISAVMISAQYMNNLPGYLLDAAKNPSYGGAELLPKWFIIAGSATAIASFLYYLYIAMDITVANRRKVFIPFDPENPHYALDTFKSIFR